MPDFDALHHHVRKLDALLRDREEGSASWCGCVYAGWKAIAELWLPTEQLPITMIESFTTYEVIKVIEAWGLGFRLGNAVKCIARAGKKPGAEEELEDLKKARWYLERQIRALEEG